MSAHAVAPASRASSRERTGAVGYADIAYALKNHLKFFSVQNRAKKFAGPGLAGIKAASLADRKFSPQSNELSIVNPPGSQRFAKAYPICTYTYVILRTQSEQGQPAEAVRQLGAHLGSGSTGRR